jgi:hypothetical protein
VICPPEPLGIKQVCHDPMEIVRVYEIGRKVMFERLDEMREFMRK